MTTEAAALERVRAFLDIYHRAGFPDRIHTVYVGDTVSDLLLSDLYLLHNKENLVRKFTIEFTGEIDLDESQIWPDRNGPEDPTAEDVAAVMRSHGPMARTLRDWGLLGNIRVDVDGVEVWK